MTMTVSVRGMPVISVVHARGFFRAHAGRRLVEQQHLRLAGERQRDLELALAAIAELADRGAEHVGEADPFGDLVGLRVQRESGCRIGRQNTRVSPVPQRAGEREIVAHREIGEQVVALERARDADARAARSRRGAVTSRPANRTAPESGRRLPASRLK